MALTVKQLHGASSFLLTFEPIDTSDVALSTQPFHILLDPCIVASPSNNSSSGFFSTTTPMTPPHAADADLPLSAIDVALISSPRRCHCHEPTLRRLPPRTRILAAPLAARRIRGWRHFHTVETLPRWDDSARGARKDKERDKVLRIPILSKIVGGEPGEVTLTYIGPKRGSHVAIGITYRPPMVRRRTASPVPPPPLRLPTPALSFSADDGSSSVTSGSPPLFLPATPPPPLTPTTTPTSARSCGTEDSTVSVVFAPHGIAYTALQGYATAHLLQESALPLTALLHCFEDVSPPWYSYRHHRRRSALTGQVTAAALGARAWIGARGNGDKDGQRASEVQRALDRCFADGGEASPDGGSRYLLAGSPGGGGGGGHHHPTEVRALAVGEEVAMTSEGVWEEETLFSDEGKWSLELLGLGLDMGDEEGLLPVDWLGNAW